ncbi:MAG: hypothetical protein E7523_04405 [Ruminococcaceae bacterium]|nr:hypothetical protein [Oscillospiraceae bacterium]
MKKLLCILLALMMTVFACIPAAAATDISVSTLPGVDLADDGDGMYTVSFTQPSEDYKDGYWFATSKDGDYEYVLEDDPEKLADPQWLYENDYIYDEENDRYILAKDIIRGFPENPVYYTIKKMPGSMAVEAGEIVTFKVKTSPKYNQTTVVVRANGVNVQPNVKGEYSVLVNQDIVINVVERGENGEVLLRSHFFVYLPKGEEGEYRCRTLENTNYQVVYYGDSFDFRLVLGKDTVVNNLSVSVTRGKDTLSEELGFDPSAILGQIGLGNLETLTSYGTDATGARLYRVPNVTTDITINVSGVKTVESFNTMNLIMRILRFILNLLGINLPFLQDMNVTYDVTIKNDSSELDYTVLQGATQDELNGNIYKVGNGDNISLVVYKYAANQDVTVTWTPGNEIGGNYASEWIADYDQNNERAYYYAIYNIDNITENTIVTISPGA